MTYTFAPTETLDKDDDDGTIVENVAELGNLVVGHRIVSVGSGEVSVPRYKGDPRPPVCALRITLDTGRVVELVNDGDCCAYTELDSFLLNADRIDHIITGISTLNGYQTWSIFADMGDVLTLKVGWSCGNPFYYGYGFQIVVTEPSEGVK